MAVASESQRPGQEESQTLETATAALRQSERMLAAEGESLERLQQVATKLISAQGIEALYEEILDTLQAIMCAHLASIQMFYPERGTSGELRLLGHRGFSEQAAKRWEWVSTTTNTTCGEALRTGRKVAVSDIRKCEFLAGTEDLEGYLDAGVRAAHTMPLVSRSGALLGMVSTYWRECHDFSASELRLLDVLARLAADLIERSRAEEKVRESEARLKSAERITHVGHWTWNLKTNRASWSEEIFRIMGQPQDYEPVYDSFLQMVVSGDRDRLEEWVRDCVSEKRGGVIEYRVVRPSGEERTVVSTSEVLLDEDGSPELFFGACQDVTDARRAQEDSAARQNLESLGTLASGIAHDFNNLLGAVLAQTELAMTELATGSHPNEELRAIRDVAIRGSEIVRQLMIYAGKENDVQEPVDVSIVVEGMRGLLKIAVSPHATLVTDLSKDLPVRVHAAQVSQIVMNLVVNASEALGDHDGVVRVTTKHTTLGPAEANAKALSAGEYVQLEVSDTGCGISPEIQAKIFDPFFTTKFSGRGLGLAVVHGIVRSLGGAIQVASQLGKGTTLQVLLPCAEAGENPDAGRVFSVEESAQLGRRAALLIVEDEEQLRRAVAQMLRKLGLEVFEVASGSAAIDLLRARGGEIELILLDLTIPGSSSQEVVAEAALARPDVKVILTSAYAEQVAMRMTDHPLVCGFIRKPFKLRDLVQTLRSVLFSSDKRRIAHG
jgi:PAS domain S-box-containing protein